MEITPLPSRVILLRAEDPSQTGAARRQAVFLASTLEFDEIRQGQLGIIVTEAARNIELHAGEGEIVLVPWRFGDTAGIDVLALDRGKGIADIARCMEDGFSTAGTAGNGLGAMLRQADIFQIYSAASTGTAVFMRVYRISPDANIVASRYPFGVVSLPILGESRCGDAWSAIHEKGRSIYIVADGLGHGPAAAEAAEEAIRIFHQTAQRTPAQILEEIHGALAKTRGAAVSIAEVSRENQVVNYAGVGNIASMIFFGGKSRSLVSMTGIAGHVAPKIQQFSYPCEPNSTLIMHSDGLATRWNIEQYPGLSSKHPALIAAVLFRDHTSRRDDVTVLVSRM